ncbi:hypothetical protein AB0I39_33310 [Kitasatospora purpeofusca]|uniref:hypothetical protein n=1 Tax=Kitasatospora purpeofusca TaxID=67352 RepID=UPI0033F0E292
MAGASYGSIADEVNTRDVFLGFSTIGDTGQRVRWDNSGAMVVMKPVPGDWTHDVVALNDPGLAVGSSGSHAAVWDSAGNATRLPDETPDRPACRSSAEQINNAGQIIGNVDCRDVPGFAAVIWR